VKQLLPAALLAMIIHGLLFSMDFQRSHRVMVNSAELKTINVLLTREMLEKKPGPVLPPVPPPAVPLVPVPESDPKAPLVPKPPEKPISKRAEAKRIVPAKKKMPPPAPPPAIEAERALPEKMAAGAMAAAPVSEETNSVSAISAQPSPASDEVSPSATGAIGNISEARPRYKKNLPPNYPNFARKRNAQGTVVIRALVNESGKVEEARVEISSGHALLDEAALMAVKSWEFEPGRRGNNPVKSYVKLPITFQLK
jgi:periplasmic protein TonB